MIGPELALLGEGGPEAVIPLRSGRLFVAPLGTGPDQPEQWVELGRGVRIGGVVEPVDDVVPAGTLTPSSLTTGSVSFTATPRSLRSLYRLIYGGPLLSRARARSVTRRKYRARARRRT